jgi:hypothetical protein
LLFEQSQAEKHMNPNSRMGKGNMSDPWTI